MLFIEISSRLIFDKFVFIFSHFIYSVEHTYPFAINLLKGNEFFSVQIFFMHIDSADLMIVIGIIIINSLIRITA